MMQLDDGGFEMSRKGLPSFGSPRGVVVDEDIPDDRS
jgi:hypothetical protein